MKRLSVLFFVFFGFLFMTGVAATGFCWDSASVSGEGEIQAAREHGNLDVGGLEFLDASAKFSAKGLHSASGSLDLEGCLIGSSFQFSNFGISWNLGSLTSRASATGSLTNAETKGLIGQGTWVNVGSLTNYAAGQNITLAEYEVGRSARNPGSVEGGALVGGLTLGFVKDNPSQKESFINTTGGSLAWIRSSGGGDPIAKGEGSIEAQSAMFKPGLAAVANVNGSASYSASGPRFAAGFLSGTGHTEINAFPNGVHVSSSVKAKAGSTSR